ncbi:ABC transporter ATP-binding protein [Devosia rhodophyticola]|uniref:ABC transporter ATP-binding protein n=1 Tax=Devosia rhodophyticola TaxID=3026423 RepID=A0ABY7YVZ8_9HYPH|nr:ABC transporter ATP-binding protein [Devosia rhodophyticola]WDR05538.1 ABC transporter ATP-binding protein [Devosia rhodophyticola]
MTEPNVSPLLSVDDLVVEFHTEGGVVRAVNGVSFAIEKGATLALIGESGCGKSVTSLALLNLVRPPGKIASGTITYTGDDAEARLITDWKSSSEQMRQFRGAEVAMIFQEPMTSFDPLFTIGEQIVEMVLAHRPKTSRSAARDIAIDMLGLVRLPQPEVLIDRYPHQLSGGMRQRVMIAMALCCGPNLLIADEPTTALDVTTESQILDLLRQLQSELGMAMLFITHDLAVASEVADDIAVMYLGYVVERGAAADVLSSPSHPYTRALLDSLPKIDTDPASRLNAIKGMVPTPDEMPRGCPFHTRCREAMPGLCDQRLPELYACGQGHQARCFLVDPQLEVLRG